MAANIFHKHFHHRHKKKPKKELIDKVIYVAVFIGPIMTLPQAYEVWFKDSTGVSLISWFTYLVIAAVWLVYGIKHRELPIILSQTIWIVLDLLIVLGLVLQN